MKIKSGYFWLMKIIRTNVLQNFLVTVLVCTAMIIVAVAGGIHHKNKEAYIKAMTVSDINQTLNFSKTGAGFKLYPQKRNGEMTIIPFKLEDTESQSTDAEDYKVALMPIMRKALPNNIKSSIVFFGSTGEGAIAIKGNLPKEPVAMIVTNNSNFTSQNNGDGKITIAGEDTDVDYNGVGFTINAKANNVKKDKVINTDMSMSDLYYTAFAKKQLEEIDKNYKKSVKAEKQFKNKEASKIKDIKKANKALDKDENNMSYDNSVDTDDSSAVSGSSMDDTISSTDTSNIDIKNKRNSTIDELENVRDDIESAKDYQEGNLAQAKQIENYAKTKVYDLLSINNDTTLRKNDDVK